MVDITVRYEGSLRCTATHGPSGTQLSTDAPKDNHGRGETFSPTDLLATAFATCVMTIMGIVAQREGIDLGDATAHVQKVMVADPGRRVGALPLEIRVPGELSADQRTKLENAARACPVCKSLSEAMDRPIEFVWS